MLDVRPLAGSLGAEIRGLDLASTAARTDELTKLLGEHLALFIPGIAPTAPELRDLAAAFGALENHPFLDKVDPEMPEVCVLDTGKTPKADVWHADAQFSTEPPVASLLHYRSGPEVGGDTMWINLQDAYDTLSAPMRAMLEELTCRHDSPDRKSSAEHPLVRVHPQTGRKSIYASKQHSRRIPQLSQPESQALLAFLWRWLEQVRFSCRWQWSPGDIAIWDNRATWHIMVNDTTESRVLHRVTVLGDRPEAAGDTARWQHFETDTMSSSGYYGFGYEF